MTSTPATDRAREIGLVALVAAGFVAGLSVVGWATAPLASDRAAPASRAIDIMAPRGTPVFAVEDGTIARLDEAQPGGGIAVYQHGPEREFVYYYAHLEALADGLEEGDAVGRGQVIGYVGSTGNAAPDAPHLHFAITLAEADGRWWGGVPINPFGLFRAR